MRAPTFRWAGVGVVLLLPLALRAQTWVGGTSGNTFNTAANWSPSGVPAANGDLTFGGPSSNTNISVNLTYTANSLTFTSAAPHYFFNNGGNSLSLAGGGLTTATGGSGVDFNTGLTLALTANQTWTNNTAVAVNGTLSGGSNTLTKAGTGALTLTGNNTLGGLTISAGAVYLGQFSTSNTPAGSGTIAVQSGGTLGTSGNSVTISNAVALSSGGTLGGANGSGGPLTLSGTVTAGSTTTTMNLGAGETHFTGTLTAPSGTALTVASNGLGFGILTGSVSNVSSMTVDNAAIAFGNTSTLPTTSLQAANGGYVSIADVGMTTPTVSQLLGLITNKAAFNGTIGFDTSESASVPTTFSSAIDLSGFTDGQVRLGTTTSAIISGTITPPAQSYDFGGYAQQGGAILLQSNLTERNGTTTNVTVVSPSASGGVAQNGMGMILQGTNTYSGNLTLSYSGVLLDSATALPSGTFSLGNNSYIGYTENTTYASFAAFAAKMATNAYTATSILGIDSHSIIDALANGTSGSVRTVSDNIDLSAYTSIYLGSFTGVTLSGSQIKAPSDTVLRVVNLGESGKSGNLTLNMAIPDSDAHSLVAGMAGARGTVVLTGNNGFTGGTSLLGGQLLAGHDSALGTGAIAVGATTGDNLVLGASTNGITLANNITVTDKLQIGVGSVGGTFTADTHTITLNGTISDVDGSHHGRLYFATPTTVNGANTYTGGTYVLADTTVSTNTGLGTSFVDLGYNANLTFTSASPAIGVLADAGSFLNNAGTGTLKLANGSTLSINQTSSTTFSGQITGTSGATTAAIAKNGSGTLALTGNNSGQFTGGITVNAGTLTIGDSVVTTATYNSPVTVAGGTFVFRPGASQTMAFSSTISGSTGSVNINGNSTGVVSIGAAVGNFTAPTTINASKLQITGDDYWSNASNLTVNGGSTFQVDGNQTVQNLVASGTVNIATTGKALTVNSTSTTTASGSVTGNGGLVKTGTGTFLLTNSGNSYSGGTTITGGVLQVSSNGALGNTSGGVTLNGGTLRTSAGISSARTLNFSSGTSTIDTNGFNSTFSGSLSGIGTFVKSGSGRLTLSSATGGGFSGPVSVSGGSMLVTGSGLTGIATSVSGSGTQLFGSNTLGAISVGSGAQLGAFNGSVPATLTGTSLTFSSGSKLDLFLTNAGGTAGIGYGTINLSGSLTLSSLTIALLSYNSGSPGLATFDPTQSYSFTLATTTGISGFSAPSVTVDTTAFSNSYTGTWSVAQSGNNLLLNYAGAIPEPGLSALLAGLAATGLVLWRRRQRAAR